MIVHLVIHTAYVRTVARDYHVGDLIWPGDATTPADSVFIHTIIDPIGGQYRYVHDDEWYCRFKAFGGRFVDRNTIEGYVLVGDCETEGNTPMPQALQDNGIGHFPITYHRLEL